MLTGRKDDAASVYEAEYKVPYLAHACMEPMNATAWVRDGKCDLWAGTQNPLGTRMVTAKTLDMDPENVTLHTAFMGGGFGRRATPDYTNQAVQVAAKAGVPVKLIWSREETTQQDHYRPSVLGRFKAGLVPRAQHMCGLGLGALWITHSTAISLRALLMSLR